MMNLYIVDHTVNLNILKSQLLVPLVMLLEHNSNFKILMPLSYGERLGNLHPLHNNFIFYNNRREKIQYLLKVKSTYKYIYSRSVLEFFTLRIIKLFNFSKFLIVYDFRGLSFAEFELKNKKGWLNSIKVKVLYALEKYAFRKADRVHTVSYQFKEYLEQQFRYNRHVVVIPCCIREANKIDINRSKDNKFSFVYLGSVSEWQKFEYTISLFGEIQKNIAKATLTIITNDKKQVINYLKTSGVQADIMSLPHEEVINELRKHNFGFLLRDQLLLNKVASPVKFLEYLNSGVTPIISDGVGDYSNLVVDKGIGILYENMPKDLIEKLILYSQTSDLIEILNHILIDHSWDNFYLKLDFK